jgi:hypothetical protein
MRHYQITADILSRHATSRTPINASSAFLDLFFDVISDLTFGKSFDKQTTKKPSPIVVEFLKKQRAFGFAMLNMPLLHIARNLRISRKKQKSWEGWYDEALQARSKVSQSSFTHIRFVLLINTDACPDVGHIYILV